MNMHGAYALAQQMARTIKAMPNVSDVYIPQDLNYPGLALNIDRERASQLGLSAQNVVDNVITAMTSSGMIAPSYWIDPKSGNNYMVTVQYFNHQIQHMNLEDFREHSLARRQDQRATRRCNPWLRSMRSTRRRKSITIRFAASSTSMSPPRPKRWRRLENRSTN